MVDRAEFRFVLVDQGGGPGGSGPPVGEDDIRRGQSAAGTARDVLSGQSEGSRESEADRAARAEGVAREATRPPEREAGPGDEVAVAGVIGPQRPPAEPEEPETPTPTPREVRSIDIREVRPEDTSQSDRDRLERAARDADAAFGQSEAGRESEADRSARASQTAIDVLPVPEPPAIDAPVIPTAEGPEPPAIDAPVIPTAEGPEGEGDEDDEVTARALRLFRGEDVDDEERERIRGAAARATGIVNLAARPSVSGLATAAGGTGIAAFAALGVAATAVAAVFGTVVASVKQFDEQMMATAQDLAFVNADIARAQAERIRAQAIARIERGEVLGPGLAQFVESRTQLDIALQKLSDSVTAEILDRINPTLKLIADAAEAGASHSDRIADFLFDIPKTSPVFGKLFTFLGLANEALRFLQSDRLEDADNFVGRFEQIDPTVIFNPSLVPDLDIGQFRTAPIPGLIVPP